MLKKENLNHIFDQCVFISLNPEKKVYCRIPGYTEDEELSLWISILGVRLCELLFKSIFLETDILLKDGIKVINKANYKFEIEKTEWSINILKSKLSQN